MMEIVWGSEREDAQNDHLSSWCAHRIWPGENNNFGPCATMGVLLNGEIIAVVVYHNWTPAQGIIEFTGTAENRRWLTRRVLHEMFSYPFSIPGIQMVFSRTSENQQHLRQLKAYGFNQVRIPRLYGRDEDGIINTLTIEQWRNNRFEKGLNHGQQRLQRTAAA